MNLYTTRFTFFEKKMDINFASLLYIWSLWYIHCRQFHICRYAKWL